VLCDSTMLDVCDFPQVAAAMGVEAQAPRSAPPTVMRTSAGGTISAATAAAASPYSVPATDPSGHMRRLEEIESEMIRLAIARYEGHMSEVARRLGIGRSTLYRKLKDLGLEQHMPEEAAVEERRQMAS